MHPVLVDSKPHCLSTFPLDKAVRGRFEISSMGRILFLFAVDLSEMESADPRTVAWVDDMQLLMTAVNWLVRMDGRGRLYSLHNNKFTLAASQLLASDTNGK
jgi:hypothetical protein